MAEPILQDELEDFPILHSVVESGDETIIQTSRIGHDMIRELRSISAYSEPHIHVGQDSLQHAADASDQQASVATERLTAIEAKMEAIIEKHISALRGELGQLLKEALPLSDDASTKESS